MPKKVVERFHGQMQLCLVLTALFPPLLVFGLMLFHVLSQSLPFNFEGPLIPQFSFQIVVFRTEHSMLGMVRPEKERLAMCLSHVEENTKLPLSSPIPELLYCISSLDSSTVNE